MQFDQSHLEESCLMILQYFGIFRYPLTLEEVHRFIPAASSVREVSKALDSLVHNQIIYRIDEYFLPGESPQWVNERKKGNAKALKLLGRSGAYARIISAFPFVRGIAISGSLSKFYAAEDADLDFFIITDPDRLWIARSLLHMFKKLTFLTGHQHYFCMNYFVDTEALKITHRNLYSSIEVVTLLPVYNETLFHHFMQENLWATEYLPNHPGISNRDYLLKGRKQFLKAFLEQTLNLLFPDKLNRFLMNLTDRKWRRKWKRFGYPENEYDHAFLTDLHISKNHPADYEKKVLTRLSYLQLQIQHNL